MAEIVDSRNTPQKNKSNKRTYVGWGSKELIGFLSSLGKDTSKPLDELEITGVIKGYIKQKKLYKDDKKLCFLCDDKLQPLFARRKVRCKMIRRFLAVHLSSNAVSEDERFCSHDEDDDDAPVIKKRPRNSLESNVAKRVSERSKRHFVSLTLSNINLIYLRRTLVVSLLNQPDTFEQKVVGCFVKVRCGKMQNSYEIPKKPYVLGQVTGIKKSKDEYIIKIKDTCTSTNVLLCVTGLLADVSISVLSDVDLEEDECDDLVSLAEKGLLKRTTVADLEDKVATVHTDIVNHWIERELGRLERKITIAHMKGLHKQLVELLDQEKLLNTPAERQRRLEEVPDIVPDTEYGEKETELQVAASNSSQENGVASKQGDATREEVDPGLIKLEEVRLPVFGDETGIPFRQFEIALEEEGETPKTFVTSMEKVLKQAAGKDAKSRHGGTTAAAEAKKRKSVGWTTRGAPKRPRVADTSAVGSEASDDDAAASVTNSATASAQHEQDPEHSGDEVCSPPPKAVAPAPSPARDADMVAAESTLARGGFSTAFRSAMAEAAAGRSPGGAAVAEASAVRKDGQGIAGRHLKDMDYTKLVRLNSEQQNISCCLAEVLKERVAREIVQRDEVIENLRARNVALTAEVAYLRESVTSAKDANKVCLSRLEKANSTAEGLREQLASEKASSSAIAKELEDMYTSVLAVWRRHHPPR